MTLLVLGWPVGPAPLAVTVVRPAPRPAPGIDKVVGCSPWGAPASEEEGVEEERGPVLDPMLLLMVWANDDNVGWAKPFCPIPWIVTGPGGWLPERVTEPVAIGLGGPVLTGTTEATEEGGMGLMLMAGLVEGRTVDDDDEVEDERLVPGGRLVEP